MPYYRKIALLLGCNYPGTPFALSGCVNDANSIKDFLTQKRGFTPKGITTLYDRDMTLVNIRKALDTFVAQSHSIAGKGDIPAMVLFYSGHGSQVANNNRRSLAKAYGVNDADGDEALVPYDIQQKGFLVDDELATRLVSKLHPQAQLFIMTDCCNSGTNFDLPYQGTSLVNKTTTVSARIIQLSACQDNQFAIESNGHGLLTGKFLKVIGPKVGRLPDFRKAMADLSISGNPQNPQVSVSNRLMINGTLFAWLVANVSLDRSRKETENTADKAKKQRLAYLQKLMQSLREKYRKGK